MNPLVIIPARGGSKGIPGKNIKKLNGKPLICYTIDAARSEFPDNCILVSTDDIKIKNLVEQYGLEVPFLRPANLALDSSPTYEVLIHALKQVEKKGYFPDTIILLQPTSPFRNGKHISEAMRVFNSDVKINMVVSVKQSDSNPYYNLKEEDVSGWLQSSKKGDFNRRQDCPLIYELNGAIYIIRTSSLKTHSLNRMPFVKKYVMNSYTSLDIDNQLEWDFAVFLLESKKIE